MVCAQGETAKGDWPEEAVETMAGVVREAEAACDQEQLEITQQVPIGVPTVTPHRRLSAARVLRLIVCWCSGSTSAAPLSAIAIGPVTL